MTIDRTFLVSEDDGKLNWDANNNVMYSVVNKDAVNPYGEYRSYKIMPATGNRNHLTIQNSTTLGKSANWATHHLYAVQRKDTEPFSAYPYNGRDPNNPVVDFAKFFDGDSLDQEDIVMHASHPRPIRSSQHRLYLRRLLHDNRPAKRPPRRPLPQHHPPNAPQPRQRLRRRCPHFRIKTADLQLRYGEDKTEARGVDGGGL
ncbi:MAG: hypothetical protein Q9228_003622 [Teloschistes exilis]